MLLPPLLVVLAAASPVLAGPARAVALPPISNVPQNASGVLDRRLLSFSMEFAYLPTFGGNATHPNTLTTAVMGALTKRTGLGPDVRPGGITVDSSIFAPNLTDAVSLAETPSGGIWRTTFGPAYFQALSVWPTSSRVIWSVNLGNNTVEIARAGIGAAIKYIGWNRLYAFELGNEADHYAGSARPRNWGSANYTAQFLDWTSYLTRALNLPKHIFVAGGFAEDPKGNEPMSTVSIIKDGVESTGAVKLYAQHTYQYSTCDTARDAIATLPNLVRHRSITTYLDLWKPQIAAAHGQGREFIVGEFSSVSCGGKQNVTDTFGQSLWLADTLLYAASINVARLYLHQGGVLALQSSTQSNKPGFSWYDLWYPIASDRFGAPHAGPSFVGALLVAEAVGANGTTRVALIDVPSEPDLAVYALWDADRLSRIVALNLAPRNESTPTSQDGSVSFDLSPYLGSAASSTQARVKRLTSPGLSSKNSTLATWAGQNYASGAPEGTEVLEPLEAGGIVHVRGSEGVLVFLDGLDNA